MTGMEHNFQGLRYTILHNCTVLPLAFTSNSGSVRGGILGSNLPEYAHQVTGDGVGNHYTKTRFRHGDPSGNFGGVDPVFVPGTTIYLGPLHRHFGHAMTESMARTWATEVPEFRDARRAFLPEVSSEQERIDASESGIGGFREQILEYMNLDDSYMVTTKTEFETLVVPEPGFILFSDKVSPHFVDFVAQKAKAHFGDPTPSKKIFYGRPGDLGSVAGETVLS